MGCVMGELYAVDLILFVSATFAAAFVTGLAGFAFAIVAAAVWLHFLPPAQCTALIAAFGLIAQGWSVWKLRQSIKPARLAPFLIGGVIGVPRGAESRFLAGVVVEIICWALDQARTAARAALVISSTISYSVSGEHAHPATRVMLILLIATCLAPSLDLDLLPSNRRETATSRPIRPAANSERAGSGSRPRNYLWRRW
jgi:hypothetical protein